jgi:hypothetical protein
VVHVWGHIIVLDPSNAMLCVDHGFVAVEKVVHEVDAKGTQLKSNCPDA